MTLLARFKAQPLAGPQTSSPNRLVMTALSSLVMTVLSSLVMKVLSCLLLMLSFVTNAEPGNTQMRLEPVDVLTANIDLFIQPRQKRLQESSDALVKASQQTCQAINADLFAQLRQAWRATMDAWQATQSINYGPIDDANLSWRFQFWPDPMNLVQRKLKSRVRGRNKKNSPEALEKASVAIQGLSALEYLLFDEKTGSVSTFQEKPQLCEIVIATSENLHRHAQRLMQDWQTLYPARWLDKQHESSHPGHYKRQLEKVYSGWVMVLGSAHRDRLGKPLGYKKATNDQLEQTLSPNPWLLESWRSAYSLTNLSTLITEMREQYLLSASLRDYLLNTTHPEAAALDKRIMAHFADVQTQLAMLKGSAFGLISQGDTGRLQTVYEQIKTLYHLAKNDYSKLTGLQFRFNAHDGD